MLIDSEKLRNRICGLYSDGDDATEYDNAISDVLDIIEKMEDENV